jgi:hypothetical protein
MSCETLGWVNRRLSSTWTDMLTTATEMADTLAYLVINLSNDSQVFPIQKAVIPTIELRITFARWRLKRVDFCHFLVN